MKGWYSGSPYCGGLPSLALALASVADRAGDVPGELAANTVFAGDRVVHECLLGAVMLHTRDPGVIVSFHLGTVGTVRAAPAIITAVRAVNETAIWFVIVLSGYRVVVAEISTHFASSLSLSSPLSRGLRRSYPIRRGFANLVSPGQRVLAGDWLVFSSRETFFIMYTSRKIFTVYIADAHRLALSSTDVDYPNVVDYPNTGSNVVDYLKIRTLVVDYHKRPSVALHCSRLPPL